MKEAPRRFWMVMAGAVLMCGVNWTQAAEVSLKAIRHNGTLISPTNTLAIAPGDSVEAEIIISGWAGQCPGFCTGSSPDGCISDGDCTGGETCIRGAADRLSVYQMTIDFQAASDSSGCGSILPRGWPDSRTDGARILPDTCDVASDNADDRCDLFIFPDCPNGTCAAKLCTESSSNAGEPCTRDSDCDGGVCRNPSDFIFAGLSRTCAVDTSSLRYRYGCSTIPINIGKLDTGLDYYGGTVQLVASEDSAGTYTFSFSIDDGGSFLTDITPLPGCHPSLTGESLVLNVSSPCEVGACCMGCACELVSGEECSSLGGVFQGTLTNCEEDCPGGIASVVPPNCASDARIPHNIDSPTPQIGWRSVDLTFCPGTDINAIAVGDFSTSVVPNDVLLRTVTAVTPMGGNVLRVDFNRIFALRHWNCLMHDPSGSEFCWGRHPADVNESLTSNTGDIQHLMDALNGSVSKEQWQCDLDRSGVCGPGDLVTGIDLLNGAGVFTVWMGQTTVELCPTAP